VTQALEGQVWYYLTEFLCFALSESTKSLLQRQLVESFSKDLGQNLISIKKRKYDQTQNEEQPQTKKIHKENQQNEHPQTKKSHKKPKKTNKPKTQQKENLHKSKKKQQTKKRPKGRGHKKS